MVPCYAELAAQFSQVPESWQETILQAWRYLCERNDVLSQSEIFPSVVAFLERLRQMAQDASDLQFNVLVTGMRCFD